MSSQDFQLEFDLKCNGNQGAICIGDSNYKSARQNRISIGKYTDVVFSSWVSTSTSNNVNGNSVDTSYHNYKIVRDGSDVKYYLDDILLTTLNPPFLSDVHSWTLYATTWASVTYSVKNIKLKAL